MVLISLLGALTLHAGAGLDPASADCARPANAFDASICSEPTLAALDQRMAERYVAALAALPPAARPYLEADQRLFLEGRKGWREASHPLRDQPLGPGYWTGRRIAFLEGVEPGRAGSFSGFWRNASGFVVITDEGNGVVLVEIEASQPVGGHWKCYLDLTARPEGGALSVVLDEEETGGGRWRLRAEVTEGVLKLTERPVASRGEERPPYCGVGGYTAGTYFRTGD